MRPRSCVNLAASENSSGLALMGPPVRLIRVGDATDSMRERHSNQLVRRQLASPYLVAGAAAIGVAIQFASPYFDARSPAMLNVQKVRLALRAPSRLVWLATCHSTKLMQYALSATPNTLTRGAELRSRRG